MRLAAQNPAIPVPEIYYFDTAHDLCDSDYFFMEKLRGENYGQVRNTIPAETQAQIDRQAGAIVREINNFRGEFYGYDGNPDLRAATWKAAFLKIIDSVIEDGIRKNADYGCPVDEIRAVIDRHAPALEPVDVPRMVHWDAWDLNFFVQDGRITGLLDFERVLWGDPLLEAQFRIMAWVGVTEALHGYGKTTFTRDEEARCQLYNLHLGLVMKTECHYRNYDTDEVGNIGSGLIGQSLGWLNAN